MFDREFHASCVRKLLSNPPNPDLYRAGFLSGSIAPPGEPPLPGSTTMKCANCPDLVVIGPQQQQALRGEPLLLDLVHLGPYCIGLAVPVLCLPCIGALTMIAPDIGIGVAGIGGE